MTSMSLCVDVSQTDDKLDITSETNVSDKCISTSKDIYEIEGICLGDYKKVQQECSIEHETYNWNIKDGTRNRTSRKFVCDKSGGRSHILGITVT